MTQTYPTNIEILNQLFECLNSMEADRVLKSMMEVSKEADKDLAEMLEVMSPEGKKALEAIAKEINDFRQHDLLYGSRPEDRLKHYCNLEAIMRDFKVAISTPSGTNPLGTYRHYKGGIYELLHIGKMEESREAVCIYKAHDETIWVRPYHIFFGMVEVLGVKKPRFEKVFIK